MFYRIVVFHNLTKNTYYYKKLKGYVSEYYVGYKNQWNHEVVLIIDVEEFLNCGRNSVKRSMKRRVIDRLMSFLNKLYQKD